MKHTRWTLKIARTMAHIHTSTNVISVDFKTLEQKQDAHLIAAAPDMLEALEKAAHDLEALRLSSDEDDYPLEVVNYLDTYMLPLFQAAIAKARGES